MKAKQRFYALGQSAKMRGVNRFNALKTYHMNGAPKWARNAFLAGWDDAETEHEISYTFEELSERAKDKVREWLSPDHDWWDSVYDTLDEDSKEHHIILDRKHRPLRSGRTVTELCLYFDSRYGYDVTFEGDLDIRAAVADWQDEVHQSLGVVLFTEGAIHNRVDIKEGKLGDIETCLHDCEVESGPMQGASIEALLDAAEELGYFTRLEAYLESKVKAFKKHAEKMLEDEYEYLSSDEYIAETCEANEYRFDEDGNHL